MNAKSLKSAKQSFRNLFLYEDHENQKVLKKHGKLVTPSSCLFAIGKTWTPNA
jgi:hypothetical protein